MSKPSVSDVIEMVGFALAVLGAFILGWAMAGWPIGAGLACLVAAASLIFIGEAGDSE